MGEMASGTPCPLTAENEANQCQSCMGRLKECEVQLFPALALRPYWGTLGWLHLSHPDSLELGKGSGVGLVKGPCCCFPRCISQLSSVGASNSAHTFVNHSFDKLSSKSPLGVASGFF